jgi:hypothetical protein
MKNIGPRTEPHPCSQSTSNWPLDDTPLEHPQTPMINAYLQMECLHIHEMTQSGPRQCPAIYQCPGSLVMMKRKVRVLYQRLTNNLVEWINTHTGQRKIIKC